MSRKAVEQTYGYLVRNSREFGILTTANGWCFMYRGNLGKLVMTPLMDGTRTNPTILQCLYFMSYKTAGSSIIVETDVYGRPIRLRVNNGQVPRPPGPYPPRDSGSSTRSGYDYHAHWDFADPSTADPNGFLEPRGNINALLEPWLQENHLGPKTYLVRLEFGEKSHEQKKDEGSRAAGGDGEKSIEQKENKDGERGLINGIYVGKFWDGYKNSNQGRDDEVSVYQKLRPLWGKTVPNFIATGEVDFFWTLFIERIEVTWHTT